MDLGNYLTHRDKIQTGDLLAVSGSGIASTIVKWWTRSDLSHVGMFIKGDGDWLLLLHSTTKKGVVMEPVFRYLQDLKGTAQFIPLNRKECKRRNPEFMQSILAARREIGRNYNMSGIFRYAFKWIRRNQSARYCSELIALLWQRAGLIDKVEVTPSWLIYHSGLCKAGVPLA